MENRTLQSCEEILGSFCEVRKILMNVQAEVRSMRENVRDVSTRLSDAQLGASAIVAETGDLRRKLLNAEKRTKVAALFCRRFMLTRSEEKVLDGDDITDEFLEALAKLERIHFESRNLLRSRNQRAGLEVRPVVALPCHHTSALKAQAGS